MYGDDIAKQEGKVLLMLRHRVGRLNLLETATFYNVFA